MNADIVIVGGGVAGLSLAAALAPHRRVVVTEAEEVCGHHSSGRSVSFSHFGIGNQVVRTLTAVSRAFFMAPPAGFSEVPLAGPTPALFIATPRMLSALAELRQLMAPYAPGVSEVEEAELRPIVPILRTGGEAVVAGLLDPDGLKLDSNALLQGYARAARGAGAAIIQQFRVARIERRNGEWSLLSEQGATLTAPLLVNAAGAWADMIAAQAGLGPLGLTPLRRTAILVDAPEGTDARSWPFTKTVIDDFYMLTEGGKLIASPVDELPAEPCDAQPEELDIAVAAAKVEEYTTLSVRNIGRRWAGLRTFAADRRRWSGPTRASPASSGSRARAVSGCRRRLHWPKPRPPCWTRRNGRKRLRRKALARMGSRLGD